MLSLVGSKFEKVYSTIRRRVQRKFEDGIANAMGCERVRRRGLEAKAMETVEANEMDS